jgi:glucan phosphoethanolaminetransferase (alkaline phosphatase superfamily)
MVTIGNVFFIWWMVFSVNGSLKVSFDRKTMYRDQSLADMSGWFILLFVCFGFLMFLFTKQVREYRKNYFIKSKIKRYEEWLNITGVYVESFGEIKNITPEQYFDYKRYLKLQRIIKKTKRWF